MEWAQLVAVALVVVEYGLKLVAVGTVPENRRPSSSSAWLLLILFVPVVGFPLYWLIGSPYLRGRRHEVQTRVNRLLDEHTGHRPTVPPGADPSPELASVLRMARRLSGMPCVTGTDEGLFGDAPQAYAAMAEAVAGARTYVHVEFYIMAWDGTTDPFFTALAQAVRRGVRVRLLMDHLGSRRYPGWRAFRRRLTDAGIDWHLMMPIAPLRGRWRRPDLRNHRKLLVVDGEVAFLGSHNMIDPAYGSARNARAGRRWNDLTVRVRGEIVRAVEAVFATDWYLETGQRLTPAQHVVDAPSLVPGGPAHAMQLIPSGPGFPAEPNLRVFTALVHQATETISLTSPYFVPDESLLAAITTAAYRGVRIDLFVGAEADQFLVGHAQRSYYRALLEAGVHIHLYPAPAVLHAKYLTVDDTVAMIGSSNLDFRSFALDYEVMLLAFGGDLVARLQANDARYRAISRELTLQEWRGQPWHHRYLDNVCRLVSALM